MGFEDLKRKVERLRRRAQKAQGAKEQLMKQLEEEFGCDSIKEAKTLKQRLEEEESELLETFEQELADFENKYSKLLEENE